MKNLTLAIILATTTFATNADAEYLKQVGEFHYTKKTDDMTDDVIYSVHSYGNPEGKNQGAIALFCINGGSKTLRVDVSTSPVAIIPETKEDVLFRVDKNKAIKLPGLVSDKGRVITAPTKKLLNEMYQGKVLRYRVDGATREFEMIGFDKALDFINEHCS